MVETHSFGSWLRLRRKALDLTREGLAKHVGCSAATIQKLEEEERRPSEQIASRIAEIFSIPSEEKSGFLRFARGNLKDVPAEAEEGYPWRAPGKARRSNLPSAVTPLIGRDHEIAVLSKYLSNPEIRLVTLIGPPGIGKTRLSVEVARISIPDFSDGVFFVALAPLDEPNLIAPATAQAMGYIGAKNISPIEQLEEGIGEKKILLVLDNCEHIIEDVASFVSSLLVACPNLEILATSRESLRIPGEWQYPVQALHFPDRNSPISLAVVPNFPALTLFAERARAVRPDFVLDPENIKVVSSICAQLDGLPLGIELIAARIRLMSPQALLERLNDQFILSADGMRRASERQRTLNHAIDWSYNLLSLDEQKSFAYFSVFSGGFTLEDAESIFTPFGMATSIRQLITSLLDKSLLQLVSSGEASAQPRYAMLVTIQEFAEQRLQNLGEEAETRNRHLAYFLAVARKADQELRGPNQLAWLRRLESMRDNLHAALAWAIETWQTEMALQLARRLWWFWSMRSEFQEGRQWLGRVLALSDAPSFPDAYANVLTQLAHHTWIAFGGQKARPFIEQALAVARIHGKPQTLANALMVFGIVLTSEQDFAAAQSNLEESITLFREVQDRWGYAIATMVLGWSAYKKDDRASALTLSEQALALFRSLGDQYFQSVCLYEIGNLRAKQGDWEEGVAELRESLLLSRDLASKHEIASGLLRLAETEQHLGRPARAVRLYWAARNIIDSYGAWHQDDDPVFEKRLTPCRAELSESEFAAAEKEGRLMTMEQAISYALENNG